MTERQALGIDVDNYSRTGGINYRLFKQHLLNGEADFMIIKAGLGLFQNPIFNEQRRNAELHGIPYVTYHFLDPRENMREQARRYVDWVGSEQPAYILDVESPTDGVRAVNRAELRRYIDELEGIINTQPILYTRMDILEQIKFVNDVIEEQYKLWIAQYLYDIAQLPQREVQYRYFHEFTRDHSWKIPPSVRNKEIEKNVILWQFSDKGEGQYYIYNPRTDDPVYTIGKKSADLNISIKERDEFLELIFGSVPVIEDVEGVGDGDHILQPTYAGLDNQDVINLIYIAAEPFTNDPWNDWILRAELEYIGVPNRNRSQPYAGPKIEELPNLTVDEKAAILALIDGTDVDDLHTERTYPGITNQMMINIIYTAALKFTRDPWGDWILRANLEELAIPDENRGKPYTGPAVEDLPNLTGDEKSEILALI